MKAFANLFIAIAVISIIACYGAEGFAMRGGARGLQGDKVPEEVPQEFYHRARRAAADEDVPEEAPEALRNARRRRSPQMPMPDGMPPMPPMPPMPMPQRFHESNNPRTRRHLAAHGFPNTILTPY